MLTQGVLEKLSLKQEANFFAERWSDMGELTPDRIESGTALHLHITFYPRADSHSKLHAQKYTEVAKKYDSITYRYLISHPHNAHLKNVHLTAVLSYCPAHLGHRLSRSQGDGLN